MDDPSFPETDPLASSLLAWFDPAQHYLVAFSGGVDSAVVAVAAKRSGAGVIVLTARSPSLSQRDQDDASHLVDQLQLNHRWLDTTEYLDPQYQRNDSRRCYFCKSHLFDAIRTAYPNGTIVTGTNFDDLGDYRPGIQAAREVGVRAPLAELNIGKPQIRQLARYWDIPVADKPASPCLSSRLAYGVSVTPQRLAMVELAEEYLRHLLGVNDCRVRLHPDDLARIEVETSVFHQILQPDFRQQVLGEFNRIGFRYVTFDLAGQRSGSLNQVLSIQLPRTSTQ